MKQNLDIHNYDKKLVKALEKLDRVKISEHNKTKIKDFVNFNKINGMSKPRLERYIGILKDWALLFNKNFEDVSKQDAISATSELHERDYKEWTKATYKIMLKCFYKWLFDTEEYPECVKWIKTNVDRSKLERPSPDDLITEEEVLKIINLVEFPRDKAFISLLYESGARVGEIGSLQIKNISFDEYGAIVDVNGKTGNRSVRVVSSVPFLSAWVNAHPLKDDLNSPLWVNMGNVGTKRMMKYSGFISILRRAFQRAGIKKKYNPHFFRHSRASYLANHLTEFQMNQYFGWVQGSNMPATYIHMNGRKIEDSILALNGIEKAKRNEKSTLKPQRCIRCELLNSSDAKFCSKCGHVLNTKVAQEIDNVKEQRVSSDEMMSIILKDKNISSMIVQKIKEMGLNC